MVRHGGGAVWRRLPVGGSSFRGVSPIEGKLSAMKFRRAMSAIRRASAVVRGVTVFSLPMAEHNQPKTMLEGAVERIVFCNEENGWTVLRLDVADMNDLVTVVGNMAGVQPGESVRLAGEWVTDKKFGEQFRAHSYSTVQPATLRGIEKYLGSGLVRGIGKALAKRIVEKFGLSTLDVIDNASRKLLQVDGIGPTRLQRIRQAWNEQRAIRDVMVFLQSHGVSATFAVRIYKAYGQRAIAVVQENPYQLAIDIFGIGFKSADKIAQNLGIDKNSPYRAEAGLLHTLSELADDGHAFCPRDMLLDHAQKLLDIDEPIVAEAIEQLAHKALIVIENLAESAADAVFLKAMHVAETGIAEQMRELQAEGPPALADVEAGIIEFENSSGMALSDEQRDAIRRAVSEPVTIITGGPGVGKTTVIRGIVHLLEAANKRLVLCAPTGRAAMRMMEATGREASTIHRLLEFDPRAQRFKRNPETPLEADAVILDEVSMVDQVLMYHTLRALPSGCRLILVGDVDQLPSVGPGSVLRDFIAADTVAIIRLTRVFRQAAQSRIVANAHAINGGQMPSFNTRDDLAGDCFFIERDEPESLVSLIAELVAHRLPTHFSLDPAADIQVLTPMRRTMLGATNLNLELQKALNPNGPEIAYGSRVFRVGDKVMQLRNNYDLGVYNGDLGRLAAIDTDDRTAVVQFYERDVVYEFSELDELALAYACSIHKSQGSEFPAVVVPIHTQHFLMLQRNLLYTAITRAKRLVVIVGSKRALGIAVRNHRTDERHTRLADRLRIFPR